jgi:hypothetical protein
MRIPQTRWCGESGSATRNQEIGGEEDDRTLNRVVTVAVVLCGLERGVLTQRQSDYIVVDLDLEEMTVVMSTLNQGW